MCCLENQIRGTLSGQQFCARKRQLASTNALHARMQCSGGPQRKAKIRENAGTTGGRRQNAAASKSARSPSLRLPQPRVPPASACRGRRAPTAAPAAAAAHRRRHLPRPPRTDGGTAARSTYTQPLPKVLLDFRLVFSFSKFSVSHSNFDASCPAQPALAKFLWRVVRIPERGTHAQSPLVVRS